MPFDPSTFLCEYSNYILDKYKMPDLKKINTGLIRKQIQFHDRLNPAIWTKDVMHLDVRVKLLQAAMAFYKFLEVDDLLIKDIVVVGSNAAYNYTKFSDIDVHLLADLDSTSCPDLAEKLFGTKKALWGETQNVTVHGLSVELYVDDASAPANSNGMYSLRTGKWLKKPKKIKTDADDTAIISKTESYSKLIDNFLKDDPQPSQIGSMLKKIRNMRQSGLDSGGEFSTENLVYKTLRNLGYIDKLWDMRAKTLDKNLSLEETVEDVLPSLNVSHGHVVPRSDGIKARCGGPRICPVCQNELKNKEQVNELQYPRTNIRNTGRYDPQGYDMLDNMDIFSFMRKKGFVSIGGPTGYARVFSHPSLDYVVKVFVAQDHCYPIFINIVNQNSSNPHFPKFRGKMMRLSDHFYAIRMEKLSPTAILSPKLFPTYRPDVKIRMIKDDIRTKIMNPNFQFDNRIDALYPYLSEACYYVTKPKTCKIDLNSGNIMFRGDVPVIIDPYAPSNYMF